MANRDLVQTHLTFSSKIAPHCHCSVQIAFKKHRQVVPAPGYFVVHCVEHRNLSPGTTQIHCCIRLFDNASIGDGPCVIITLICESVSFSKSAYLTRKQVIRCVRAGISTHLVVVYGITAPETVACRSFERIAAKAASS